MQLSNYVLMLSLADWSVLINALMAGLMIGYGFWIHHIVKQQEKLKDATIHVGFQKEGTPAFQNLSRVVKKLERIEIA